MLKRCLLILGLIAGPASAEDLVVFAAASLKGPLDIIAADRDVTISYGGSGALARQISHGAPADVVLLAHSDWMDVLAREGAVVPDSVTAFLSNTLVIVGQLDAEVLPLEADAMLDALDGGRLAMGFTQAVPAGIYGREALERLGLWETLSPHVAEVDNVRAALALVARGEAPLGIVYQSDALVVPSLSVVARIPTDSHAPIRYFGAITTIDTPGAADFLKLLSAPESQDVFAAAGFCTDTRWC